MYERKSRLSARQQNRLMEHFVAGTTARAAAQLVGVQGNTAIGFFLRLRKLIASQQPSYSHFKI
jgi:transposase